MTLKPLFHCSDNMQITNIGMISPKLRFWWKKLSIPKRSLPWIPQQVLSSLTQDTKDISGPFLSNFPVLKVCAPFIILSYLDMWLNSGNLYKNKPNKLLKPLFYFTNRLPANLKKLPLTSITSSIFDISVIYSKDCFCQINWNTLKLIKWFVYGPTNVNVLMETDLCLWNIRKSSEIFCSISSKNISVNAVTSTDISSPTLRIFSSAISPMELLKKGFTIK